MKNAVAWPICLLRWNQITLQIVSMKWLKEKKITTKTSTHRWTKLEAVATQQLCFTQFHRDRLGENSLCWALICQNSHLQLKIKTTGTVLHKQLLKDSWLPSLLVVVSALRLHASLKYSSYVSFLSDHKVPKTKILTHSTFLFVIGSSNTTALFQFLKTDWFEHFMFYYTRVFYYTYIFY